MKRRHFLRNVFVALAGLPLSKQQQLLAAMNEATFALEKNSVDAVFDPELNLQLPANCSARIVARSSELVLASSNYIWHGAPDGGACFSTKDKGWIYVSNSELNDNQGGVGAIRFDASANIIDAYSILDGTTRNCAGGRSLKDTWLSCEENKDAGQVYECDPYGKKEAIVLPEMGSFNHEAVAVDPVHGHYYMTEDVADGCLYRYLPDNKTELRSGKLEVAVVKDMKIEWESIHDPSAQSMPCRYQIDHAGRFKGGEGIIYHDGSVYFTTKKDNRVWQYNITNSQLAVIYDVMTSAKPILSGVDNIDIAPSGELIIAEDGGDMQLVGLGDQFQPFPIVTVFGQEQSELTGPAFSPDSQRLYFSSQRGPEGKSENGITYELNFDNSLL